DRAHGLHPAWLFRSLASRDSAGNVPHLRCSAGICVPYTAIGLAPQPGGVGVDDHQLSPHGALLPPFPVLGALLARRRRLLLLCDVALRCALLAGPRRPMEGPFAGAKELIPSDGKPCGKFGFATRFWLSITSRH